MTERIEKDAMGEVKLDASALYGASTERARQNFPISNRRLDRELIRALGLVKWACAKANQKLGRLKPEFAEAITQSAKSIADGGHDEQFVVDIFQTGSGTSSNMNINEVIANLVNPKLGGNLGSKSPVHPNDHVNMGQSSNDTIPTTIHVACAIAASEKLIPALEKLANTFTQKEKEFADIIKIGRTHLQDATPLTLGQEFSGYTQQIKNGIARIQKAMDGILELAIGGTAVGTGINTHPDFSKTVCSFLKEETGLGFNEAPNHFEAQAAKDAVVFFSGALKTLSVSLLKIANDIRWLSSGPRCGLFEITLPSLQPGSSIMPGKVNPVVPESVMQICAQVQGNDLAIQIGGQHGNFELNVMMPMMASNLIESITILANGATMLDEKCVAGITANKERCEELMEQSLALVTNLNHEIGYDEASRIAKTAFYEGKTIRELLLAEAKLSKEQIERLLDPRSMLKPS